MEGINGSRKLKQFIDENLWKNELYKVSYILVEAKMTGV
jgi:hypothetical protein